MGSWWRSDVLLILNKQTFAESSSYIIVGMLNVDFAKPVVVTPDFLWKVVNNKVGTDSTDKSIRYFYEMFLEHSKLIFWS